MKRALVQLTLRLAAGAVAFAVAVSPLAPAGAGPKSDAAAAAANPRPSIDEICRTLAQAAADNDLPEEFFTRLIWQESRFDPMAVSPMGAQGIAQFMPQTAAMRGLVNAFEPLEALRESASYLAELRTTFRGNLGLAAAAYNAGPGQVEAWLAGRRSLPGETQAYVLIVTGYAAQAWASKSPPQLPSSKTQGAKTEGSTAAIGERCVELARLMIERPRRRPPLSSDPAWGPWGVQLAGNWSEGGVLASYERLRRKYEAVLGERLPLVMPARRRAPANFLLRISESSRPAADALCARLRAAGGACVVLRNPRD